MKSIQQEHLVVMSDHLKDQAKTFSIEMNAKIARLLSDKLYSNKIQAIIRELSTNAYDSHVENGNADQPFEVCLPKYGDNTFWIRDFGTGMSHEKVMELYTTYGWSNRDDSNEYVGSYGVGSKSILSYHTRCATIDSWYKGIHNTYQVFLNNENIPTITPLCSHLSDEPSGVKITIKTHNNDINNFVKEAQTIYRYFKVKPRLYNRPDVNLPTPEYEMSGTSWSVRTDGGKARAIMGQVSYEINYPSDGSLTSEQMSAIASPIDIYFDLGELDVEAGREGLSFDNRTKTHVRAALNVVIEEMSQVLEKKIGQSKNLWEARINYYEIVNKLPECVKNIVPYDLITYKGIKLYGRNFGSVSLYDNEDIKTSLFHVHRQYSWRQKYSIKESKSRSVKTSRDIVLCLDDLKIGAKVRCRKYVEDNKKEVYLFSILPGHEQELYDILGLDESYFIKASSLPKPSSSITNKSYREIKTAVVQFNTGNYPNKQEYWTNTTVDMNNGGYYVETFIFDIKSPNATGNFNPKYFNDIVQTCASLGITIPKIYGVNSANIKLFKNNPKWKDFWTFILDKMEKIAYNKDIEQIETNFTLASKCFGFHQEHSYTYLHKICLSSWKRIASLLCTQHSICQFVRLIEDINKERDNIGAYRKCLDVLKSFGRIVAKSNKTVSQHDYIALENGFYKQYPMLKLSCNSAGTINDIDLPIVVSYIQLVDKNKGK